MKLILSRKGFDSSWGGYPSPILPCGTLLSLPIPSDEVITYDSLSAIDGSSYYDIMVQLSPTIKQAERGSGKLTRESQCHLDPDLRKGVRNRSNGWKPVFGQVSIAQSHLAGQHIGIGDIFLFFGLFQKTVMQGGKLKFEPSSNPVHLIYGYLEIGHIYSAASNLNLPGWLGYHPHYISSARNNTIYEAAQYCSLDNSLPGAGTFGYDKSLVLTKDGESASKWDLPDLLRNVTISYHKKGSSYGWQGGYFQSAKRGQEFVVDSYQEIDNWVVDLLKKNSHSIN